MPIILNEKEQLYLAIATSLAIQNYLTKVKESKEDCYLEIEYNLSVLENIARQLRKGMSYTFDEVEIYHLKHIITSRLVSLTRVFHKEAITHLMYMFYRVETNNLLNVYEKLM